MTEVDLAKRVRELEWQIKQLEHDLIHDPLTGLKTRAFFEEEIRTFLRVISQQSKGGTTIRKERFGFRKLSIIFFDIDHFKKVNDTYGHDAGDEVLKKVSQVIQSSVRTGDTVARWGGEEIVASLLGASENDASIKAEEIRGSIETLSFENYPELKVTVSAGVTSSQLSSDLSELIKQADQALYAAKSSGRNQVVDYSMLPD